MKLTRFAMLVAMVLALFGGSIVVAQDVAAEACGDSCGHVCVSHCDKDDGEEAAPEPAVRITGGTVTNSTTIDITADGGTAISDASGGDFNVAIASGTGEFTDVASAGNGGTASAAANGGAVSVGNVNSGGNSGNAITVGNTSTGDCGDCKDHCGDCGGDKHVCCEKPSGDSGGGDKGGGGSTSGGSSGGGSRVRELPSTGAGVAGEGSLGGLVLLTVAGAVAVAGYGLRRRFV